MGGCLSNDLQSTPMSELRLQTLSSMNGLSLFPFSTLELIVCEIEIVSLRLVLCIFFYLGIVSSLGRTILLLMLAYRIVFFFLLFVGLFCDRCVVFGRALNTSNEPPLPVMLV